jgi:hypothetical protein
MAVLRELSYGTMRVGLYEPCKELVGCTTIENTPFWKRLLAGIIAGSIAAAIANPCDVLKIRLQTYDTHHETLRQEIKNVYASSGIRGFWYGALPNVCRGAVVTAT